jgi:4-diphosphocytidyl-2C-methyl-D-erythritol kinase
MWCQLTELLDNVEAQNSNAQVYLRHTFHLSTQAVYMNKSKNQLSQWYPPYYCCWSC